MGEIIRSIFRQRQIEKIYVLIVKGNQILRPLPARFSDYAHITCDGLWMDNSPLEMGDRLVVDACNGDIICEKEIGRYDIEIPMLDVGDEFFLHDIQKVIKIKSGMRSSDGSITYYVEDEMVETDVTKKSYDECMKKIENWESECEKYDSLVLVFNDMLLEFEKYREKYKFQHRFFQFWKWRGANRRNNWRRITMSDLKVFTENIEPEALNQVHTLIKQPAAMQGLYFGALLCYRSPIDGHKTRCVYVGEDGERAVVLFRNAENVSRVNYEQLEWYRGR